ncbi:hypothetical protein K8R30_01370 [archaeon]|nr:hypothetical protein [archaeon]
MKRLGVFLILFCLIFVSAVEDPTSQELGEKEVEDINKMVENIPINPEGEVNFEGYKPFKTKADERIAKINKYVGPFSKIILGVELEISWIFIFSVVLWILLIGFILVPVREIFNWNPLMNLAGSIIIATLAMQSFGKNLVIWVESLVTAWYISLFVLVASAFFGVIYSIMMKYFAKQIKAAKEKAAKEKSKKDRAIISASSKVEEKRLENP